MKDYLRRHLWILSKLYENTKGLTYKEFAYEWDRTELNSLKTPLPKRTFADCLRAIEDAFDIQISSDARNGYRYRIVNREWLVKDNVKDWLLSAFAVNGLLQDSKGLRDRVMYETIPSGNAYLLKVLDCMKRNRVINLVYQDFFDEEPCEVLLEPYFVRVFHQSGMLSGQCVICPMARSLKSERNRDVFDAMHSIGLSNLMQQRIRLSCHVVLQ